MWRAAVREGIGEHSAGGSGPWVEQVSVDT